jgi:hypothetical protein
MLSKDRKYFKLIIEMMIIYNIHLTEIPNTNVLDPLVSWLTKLFVPQMLDKHSRYPVPSCTR